MKTIKVTSLEKQVLESLAQGMYAELGYSDMGIEEIVQDTGLSPKVIRGVGSSLVKKQLIYIDDRDGEYKNDPTMHIWYLTSETQGLVENWVGDEDYITKGLVEKVILEEIG